MYTAGKPDKPVLAKFYARYDCGTKTFYAHVVTVSGWVIVPSDNDNYVKLGQTDKLVDGSDAPGGSPPSFAYIGSKAWEAAFHLDPGSYLGDGGLNVHAQVEPENTAETAAVAGRRLDVVITCPNPTPTPTAKPTPTPTAAPTAAPSASPSASPTEAPSASPSVEPSASASEEASASASEEAVGIGQRGADRQREPSASASEASASASEEPSASASEEHRHRPASSRRHRPARKHRHRPARKHRHRPASSRPHRPARKPSASASEEARSRQRRAVGIGQRGAIGLRCAIRGSAIGECRPRIRGPVGQRERATVRGHRARGECVPVRLRSSGDGRAADHRHEGRRPGHQEPRRRPDRRWRQVRDPAGRRRRRV